VEGPTLQPDGQLPAARPSPVSFDAPLGFALHVPVLTYHLVATPREAGSALPGLVVPPALFDAQLTRLQAAGWHTITLAALASDLAAGRRPAPRTFVITIDDGRVDGYSEALPILRRHAMVATYFVIAGRIGRPGYLDAGEVRALAAVGMEIGDHSMDHVNLVRATPAELQIEVAGAAEILARITGTAPVSFAYPFGDFDAAVARAVASAGLWMAVTTRAGTLETADVRYEVPRLHVGPGTLPEDLLKRLVDQTW
jgi:peptidoglycan/xylan/chitin deacetylase (PgdA/CDA1 family)